MQAYHKRSFSCLCMLLIFTAFTVVNGVKAQESAPQLLPFSTDGCSMFPDGTVWDYTLWQSCCVAHDMAYWQGGDYMTRMAADEALRVCVDDLGEPAVGVAMLIGVRIGGSPYWPTSFRWGYGWREPRGYKPLTREEALVVERMLQKQSLIAH
ncbi:hypothetical protein MARGE09_P2584 [Marinagarivorans cellulosilyticus]|uniref:Uncharacterized protein n=2 Tax=Marinagarivorans cellulosilyticus TaxID=2721545 RepID=A0AAN1WIU0_9GAMM|nr:hypothetical protein MARGE09_P2584 [Marinagarivorans cellulosilyticus]